MNSSRSSHVVLASVLALAGLFTSSGARADRAAEITASLQEFRDHPAQAMDRIPVKRDARTGLPVEPVSPFDAAAIADGSFVVLKDQERSQLCTSIQGARICLKDVLPGRAPYLENDLAENLVDNPDTMLRTLEDMENRKLMSSELDESPWSDTYWPMYQGQVAARYADAKFPTSSKNWKTYFDYSQENAFYKIFTSGNAAEIDDLSPAEKYDLLVGDKEGGLAAYNWSEGEHFFKTEGKVEDWMGICHGWSPASYMAPRPRHTIELPAADGKTMLTFYPADIRGLASLLWAKNTAAVRMIGGRCNSKHPKKDENGRILSPDCFDTNPGTWHLAIVNQIGVNRRSFVIDATFDYQVWNQPVYSYTYTYFNPETNQPAPTLAEARVELKDFTHDKFKKYRSKDAVSVVGIAMDMTYMQEVDPSHAATNSPADDSPYQVRYLYDLELNAQGEIIGGEWYQSAHPDFMWTPGPDDKVVTSGDPFVNEAWTGESAIPDSWREAAAQTSKDAGSPLSKVVDVLTSLAHR